MKKIYLLALALVIGSAGLFATNLKRSNFNTTSTAKVFNVKMDPTFLVHKKNTKKIDLRFTTSKKSTLETINVMMSKHFIQEFETDISILKKHVKVLNQIVPLIATLE